MKEKMEGKIRSLAALCILLASIMVTGMSASAAGISYSDVHEGDWYYDYVQYASSRGFMTGYNDGSFGPSDKIIRGQFAAILYRIEGSPQVTYQSRYPDVPEVRFYSLPVTWASEDGILTGYANGKFGPEDPITREQIATILYRYSVKRGYDTSARGNLSTYPDGLKVNVFAQEAMQWATGTGLITGDQGYLNPQGNTKRAEAAAILKRYEAYVEAMGGNNPDPGEPDLPDPDEPGTGETDPDPGEPEKTYSYEIEILNKTELYTDNYVLVYVKTDNVSEGFGLEREIEVSSKGKPDGYSYDDIHYRTVKSGEGEVFDSVRIGNLGWTVNGGYLQVLMYDEPMEDTITVREIIGKEWDGEAGAYRFEYRDVASVDVTIHDYDEALYEWAAGVVDEVTTPDMDSITALYEIQGYIEENFIYEATSGKIDDSKLYTFASEEGPVWLRKRLTCISSANLVNYFAETFYGLDSGKLVYAGYLMHYYLIIELDEEEYKFEPGIYLSTGYVEEGSWEYLL